MTESSPMDDNPYLSPQVQELPNIALEPQKGAATRPRLLRLFYDPAKPRQTPIRTAQAPPAMRDAGDRIEPSE
jgi:hypothetical protein